MVAIAVLVASVQPAVAQEGRIYGSVTDADGGVLPGVTVTAQNSATGFTQVLVTNERGDYEFRGLPRGPYSLTAELSGFATLTRRNLEVGLESRISVDLRMDLSGVRETVVVVGDAARLLDVRAVEVAANVTEQQIQVLPVAGRDWINLATLLPSTGQDAIRTQFYNAVNIGAGINYYSNGYIVDGVSNNWQQQGEPRQNFPQDSIAEFRVHAFNSRAIYGFAQGGILSTVTKSGTNTFHGSAFEFYRSQAMTSKTIFQDEKPGYRRHQFGGSLGGPVVRDRAHFFVSTEYTDEQRSYTVETRGLFPEEEGTFPAPSSEFMLVGRYDQALTQNHRLFIRSSVRSNELASTTGGGRRARDTGSHFGAPGVSVVLGETWTVGHNSLNDFRFQYAKSTYLGWPSEAGLKWTESGQFPQERVDTLREIVNRPSLVKGTGSSFVGPESRWQIKNDFVRLVGRHEITVGADLNWVRWTPDNMAIGRNWSFATDAPFNPNDPSTYPFQFTQQLVPTYADISSTEHSLYVDDRWNVTSQLTLNLGLRYDLQTGVYNRDLLERDVPEIRLVDRVVQPAGKLDPALFPFFEKSNRGSKTNFGPRVGLAWNVGGSAEQVIRAAYGLYYNRFRASGGPRAELNPLSRQVIIRNPAYPDPYQGRDPFELATVSSNFAILGNDVRNPHTHQFSVGYSRQLNESTALNLNATSAFGRNQHTTLDRNYFASPAERATRVRPYSQYGRVTENRTDGEMRYEAFEARLDRRMSNGWALTSSYTVGRAKADSETFPADHFDRAADYGFAPADRRHRATINGIVDVFGGLLVGGILRYQSPVAFNVTAGRDLNGDGITNDRPPGVGLNEGCRGLDLDRVNDYRQANGRSQVSEVNCPSYLAVDLRVSRAFRLGKVSVDGIFQVFNLANRSNFLSPVGNALSPLFGQSVAVASGRQMEVALRVSF
ncbi:MAG: TonB-dependent receptor [Gemmatimonadaceae bacterium]|nr:TonB-dependent receptor [Gemmatimonadaceae bacterium]